MCYCRKSKYGNIDCLLASSTIPLYRTSSLSGNPSLYACAQRYFIHQEVASHQGTSRHSSILSPQQVNQMDSSRHKLLALSGKFIPKTGKRVFPSLANIEQSLPSRSSNLFWVWTCIPSVSSNTSPSAPAGVPLSENSWQRPACCQHYWRYVLTIYKPFHLFSCDVCDHTPISDLITCFYA